MRRCANRSAAVPWSVRTKQVGKWRAALVVVGVRHATTVVYAIQAGRGFQEAAAVLGAHFDGVLVRDGWAPYRQFDGGASDMSRASVRRCRDRRRPSRQPGRGPSAVQDALEVRDRFIAGEIPHTAPRSPAGI